MKKNMTLRNKFIYTSYLSIVISIILISIIGYLLISISSKKYAIQTNQEITRQKSQNISMRMDGLETTLRDIIYSKELQYLLGEYSNQNTRDLFETRIAINQAISGVTNSLNMFDNVVIFSSEGDMVGSMLEFDGKRKAQDYEWYEGLSLSNGDTLWLNDSIHETHDNYGTHLVLTAVKKIRSIHDKGIMGIGEEIGTILVSVNLDNVLESLKNEYTTQDTTILIADEGFQIIGGNDSGKVGLTIEAKLLSQEENNTYVKYEDKEYLLTYKMTNSNSLSWYVICMTLKEEILRQANFAIGICMSVSFVLLIVFLIISIKNANSLSKPIKLLEKQFEMVEKGDFNVRIESDTNISEIHNLFTRFNVMVHRLDTLIQEVYEARINEQKLIVDARQAEIQALQMQINPHFLYNTLDSINWMALMAGNEEVSKMTISLGHLFRANMNIKGIYITVKESIENIQLFMYLEQVRFGDKLSYQLDVSDTVMDAFMLKHLLQPLVENSIKHGIEPYNMKGEITISICEEGDNIVVCVSDNGKGIPNDLVEKFNSDWSNAQILEEDNVKDVKGGVGLSNIMRRLHLCYGKSASFAITSSKDLGTKTVITFPIHI